MDDMRTPERHVAARVQQLCRQRGFTYDGLASRMRKEGFESFNKDFVSKTFSGKRKVSVDELAAYSRIFGLPVGELLVPVEVVDDVKVRKLLDAYRAAEEGARVARERSAAALEALAEYVQTMSDDAVVQRVIGEWIASMPEVEDAETLVDYWMALLTEDERYRPALTKMTVGTMRRAWHSGMALPEFGGDRG